MDTPREFVLLLMNHTYRYVMPPGTDEAAVTEDFRDMMAKSAAGELSIRCTGSLTFRSDAVIGFYFADQAKSVAELYRDAVTEGEEWKGE